MNIVAILLTVFVGLYVLASILVFLLLNTNLNPITRNASYSISIPAQLHYMHNPKRAYWKAIQGDDAPNVILLHGFLRNSGRMDSRAQLYWERGYNVYLLDNLGHGLSATILFPSGYQYSQEVRALVNVESITHPIIHGVSMGGIAASFIAMDHAEEINPKMIVVEALLLNFDQIYPDLMRYVNIPLWLFPWMPSVSYKIAWRQFKHLDLNYDYSRIQIPIYYIHSSNDKMFLPEVHYKAIVDSLSDHPKFEHWLVPNGQHSRMNRHPEYTTRLFKTIERLTT